MTLVEVVLALALTALLAAVIVFLLLNVMSLAAFEHNRMGVVQTLRHGGLFLSSEWRSLAPSGGDILQLGPTHVRYRALRGLGIVCGIQPNAVTIRQERRYGVSSWQPGSDSLMVFATGDSGAMAPPRWVNLPLMAIGSGTNCADGSPSVTLSTVIDPARVALSEIPVGTPVRVFEPMEVKLYASLGAHWLGVRSLSAGGSIQPALGPLTAKGLELSYIDRAGSPTGDRMRVSGILATMRARSSRHVRRGLGSPRSWLVDSLVVAVATRAR